jgi:hypothetical protein
MTLKYVNFKEIRVEKRLTGNKIEDSSHLGCYAK